MINLNATLRYLSTHTLYAQAVKLGCLFRHVEHLFEHVEHLFGIGFTPILAILISNFNFNYFTCVVVVSDRRFLHYNYLDRPHRTTVD